MEDQELELLEGFRRLCPVDRNTVLTAVSMALAAEEAIKRQFAAVLPSSAVPVRQWRAKAHETGKGA